MLDAIRKRSGSIVVKLLLGLLILSFAAWGVGDMLRGPGARDVVATVGDTELFAGDLRSEYEREMQRLRPVLGDRFDPEQIRQLGIMNAVVQRVVARTLIDEEARDLGIAVNDSQVLAEIKSADTFKGQTGKFDRITFEQVLYENNLREDQFVAMVQGDLLRRPVVQALEAGSTVPNSLLAPLHAYREETRTVEMLLFAADEIEADATPSDDELAAFHKENERMFTAPEYRKISYATVNAADLAGEVAIDEEAIRQAYEDRANEFNAPQRRSIEQLVFTDQKSADAAHVKLSSGENFDAVAAEIGGMGKTSLSLLTKDEFPEELQEAVFAIPQGGFSVPLQSPLGWHIVRITKIERSAQRSFDEVKAQLRDELAKEKAIESLYEMANRIEDELAAGASINEIATSLNIRKGTVDAIDASGRGPDGKTLAGVAGLPAFAKAAFETDAGSQSELVDTGKDGYIILRVDSVTPPAVRPLNEIRDMAVNAWQGMKRSEIAKALAEKALERAKGGEALADIGKDAGITPEILPPFKRTPDRNSPSATPREVVTVAFATHKGNVGLAPHPDGYAIIRVTDIKTPSLSDAADTGKAERDQIRNAIAGDLMAQFSESLRLKHGASINTQLVESLY
ncbi:MAG: peptidyl-prolyl cis-trans isomerase [Rhodospirillales bacterium]|nr:peptidyl-prolyl cis-trans isomerase [Rhodospirillales bacterium]MCW8862563.1 peptidyl-prolyl cis-trans isomerase [Rhodospirillales bacterium]MCW8952104.1 peptidyl-prolyl cis-trans isomerase [Rhodospirillales bacterium]MCW8971134.1 peptidyl-prolyl cis-trans isomerase [Rhodospirillales bacterium]MCW9001178.1 peptidyl-prolyl cis-trans isomerase [Rhodospirillales bacterium]